MQNNNFDSAFQELQTNMVEIAFEFVNRNKAEVDTIYIFGSMEDGEIFYNVFYKINQKLIKIHKINTVSVKQYDLSDKRTFGLLDLGIDYLEAVEQLFKEYDRPVPTLMKMIYEPKTGAFKNDISYDLFYSNDEVKMVSDVFQEWFEEIEK